MSVLEIPVCDIDFHPLSFADPAGKLFRWDGQLYRAIRPSRAPFYRKLFADGVVQALVDHGFLVETELTDLTVEGYGLVVKHRTIPFVSYASEWCAPMLKDAGRSTIGFALELARQGLQLHDAHPWNILFDGTRPVHIDFGSIKPLQGDARWPGQNEFLALFVYPLHLMSCGYGRIARRLLHHPDPGIQRTELEALTGQTGVVRPFVPPRAKSRVALLQALKRELESIPTPTPETEWSDYYKEHYPSSCPSPDWTPKHHSVHRIVSRLNPRTVVDIASNRGWYSRLVARRGIEVAAFDVDEGSINKLFAEAKRHQSPILPLLVDLCHPSPAEGLCNRWIAPATERLQCDLALALAIVHHLVFKKYHLDFEQISDALSLFARRWLLVEFIPAEDRYVREWWTESYAWYTLDNFMAALRRRFRRITIHPSSPEPRLLLLCET